MNYQKCVLYNRKAATCRRGSAAAIGTVPIVIIFLVFGCARRNVIVKESRLLLGTICEITVSGEEPAKAKEAIQKTFFAVERLQRSCGYDRDSDVSRINASAGIHPVKVDTVVVEIIQESLKTSRLTDGAFDVTFAPLKKLWDFSGGSGRVPSKKEVGKILPLLGWRNIKVTSVGNEVFLAGKGMEIDLGGIAKGKAIDIAAEVLGSAGIKNALIDFGGDIYAFGERSPGSSWQVGIRHPRRKGEIIGRIPIKNGAVVTSGDYERSFFKDGKRYHHIIDPRTGFPAQKSVSVTVLSGCAMTADALATGIFVMGPDEGMSLVEKLPGVEAVIISGPEDSPEIKISSGLKGLKLEY